MFLAEVPADSVNIFIRQTGYTYKQIVLYYRLIKYFFYLKKTEIFLILNFRVVIFLV